MFSVWRECLKITIKFDVTVRKSETAYASFNIIMGYQP